MMAAAFPRDFWDRLTFAELAAIAGFTERHAAKAAARMALKLMPKRKPNWPQLAPNRFESAKPWSEAEPWLEAVLARWLEHDLGTGMWYAPSKHS